MGVIGVALSVALLPALARHLANRETAAAHGAQDMAVLAGFGSLCRQRSVSPFWHCRLSLSFERGAFSAVDSA